MKKASNTISSKPGQQQPVRKVGPPTAFRIVMNPLPEDHYHGSIKRNNRHHYQDMLRQLALAKRGSVACLDSAKPYAQVRKAAARLGYECHYAEEGGKLYVQILSTGTDS